MRALYANLSDFSARILSPIALLPYIECVFHKYSTLFAVRCVIKLQ